MSKRGRNKTTIIAGAVLALAVAITVTIVFIIPRLQRDSFGLFGEGNARPPCWWVTCLGPIMDHGKLVRSLREDPRVSELTIWPETNTAYFTFTNATGTKKVKVMLDTYGMATLIRVTPYDSYTLTFKDLVRKYGEPGYVGFTNISDNRMYVMVYYPDLEAYFDYGHQVKKSDAYDIQRYGLITDIWVVNEDWTTINKSFIPTYWTRWQGFTTYHIEWPNDNTGNSTP